MREECIIIKNLVAKEINIEEDNTIRKIPINVHFTSPIPPSNLSTSSNEITSSYSLRNLYISPKKNPNKGKITLKAYPPRKMIDTKLKRRLTRSQFQELDQVISRLDKFQMYGDDEEDSKRKIMGYALFSEVNLEP